MHNTITNLILNSKLINKIEEDLETNESLNSLMNTFIKNLTFRYFEKDSFLYHTGEIDNKFYFIFSISCVADLFINFSNFIFIFWFAFAHFFYFFLLLFFLFFVLYI